MASNYPIEDFHPAIRAWFKRRFPKGPTAAQDLGWRSIAARKDTLIAAPTGSGKTLAGFLVAIDRCLSAGATDSGGLGRTSVVYVSPLRALTVDVRENLQDPLEEIAEIADELGIATPHLRASVRNGDTSASARSAMLKNPPDIVVTTPESLYLLVTSKRGRELLSTVDTVIVDEIHAIARDKRGAHLALTLERLDRIATTGAGMRPTRIGLSATQRPIETIARLLVGIDPTSGGSRRCAVVDVGHERRIDVDVELTESELGAVMSTEQLDEVIESLATHIASHRSTLVFVNTRRMAERVAHLLADRSGVDVAAHHGSLSMDRRLSVEDRLRSGQLRAVVATASLELGIDVGPIDLVCQLGSPRSIATFLQRVGRAEHRLDGTPKGRIYPFTRDELAECVALLAAVRSGILDAVIPPNAPLDILAQQIVAECAATGDEGLSEKDLFRLVRSAAPYADLSRADFESVVALVSDGVVTGRGRRGALLHRDGVNAIVRPRRGARLTATTSGGAIPDLADFKVVLEPDGVTIGTVNEDFAVESMVGDVFLLASASWRITRVEQGTVRVVDADGAAPSIPFWFGEAPSRTDELSAAVSLLRSRVDEALDSGGVQRAVAELVELSGVDRRAVGELVAYLATAKAEIGKLPTREELVMERFFDESGGMQLVIHSPYGARVNRGLGLALRKRFCRTFDFELQAAASDDAIVLSLGPQHSFALEDVTKFLSPGTVRDVLIQAMLPTPIFTSRWRWNLSRSLVSPRFRGVRRLPPMIQRMEADDLMAAIFPMLAACQENVSGPIEIPDHLLVQQTIEDCLHEAMDIEALTKLVGSLRSGDVKLRVLDTTEASVLSHEILNGRPYTFLDDAPLEERRTRAVVLRRGIPLESHDLSVLDPDVVEEVSAEVAPSPRDAEELHDLLCTLIVTGSRSEWDRDFRTLVETGRAMEVDVRGEPIAWCATEGRATLVAAFDRLTFSPDYPIPPSLAKRTPIDRDSARQEIVRGYLEYSGPKTAEQLALEIVGLERATVATALAGLQGSGAVLQVLSNRWAVRRVVARIHQRSTSARKSKYSLAPKRDFMRFLFDHHHITPGSKLAGPEGLAAVLHQLQGYEAPIGSWEESILPARVTGYHAHLLDELATNGEISWARLSSRADDEVPKKTGSVPSRSTPVALVRRENLHWLLAVARLDSEPPAINPGATAEVIDVLKERGALFFSDICDATARLPIEVADALWDGVARGLVTADGFQAVRALLSGRYRETAHRRGPRRAPHRSIASTASRHRSESSVVSGGRWSILIPAPLDRFDPDELAEATALQLLARWGVVYRDTVRREHLALSWREILHALRRLEARGVARGGRFIEGPTSEQFALPQSLDELAKVQRREPDGTTVHICAPDPLNLTGTVLDCARVPAIRGRELVFVDGVMTEVVEQSNVSSARRDTVKVG